MISFEQIGPNLYRTLPGTIYGLFSTFVADLRARNIPVSVSDRDGVMFFGIGKV